MNVLSLFDGMSCGQIALERAGIKVDNYFASEIDKHAIKVTMVNYPDTIQLGNVTQVKAEDLPKIDLLIGGSPCQGFSFAGKQLNFEDDRSKLFFEYVRLLKELKPKYFMLENVRMKKEYQDIISEHLGVEPIQINSSLMSAQNRIRLYWTNIDGISQPKDKKIILSQVLEGGEMEYLKVSKKWKIKNNQNKAGCLTGGGNSGGNHSDMDILVFEKPHGYNNGGIKLRDKFQTLRPCSAYNYAIKYNLEWRRLTIREWERLQTVPDDYTAHVSNTQRYKMLGNGWTVDVIAHIFSHIGDHGE